MGTLGCINDMMRRDKENRELRMRNKERLHETRDRLLKIGKRADVPDITTGHLENIRKNIEEKERLDNSKFFRFTILFILSGVMATLILWFIMA